ncbi:MAG: hypothetical protein AAFU61_08165 [Pseudomonadota bacterium]
MPINLATPGEVRAAGWTAESRDADGHLKRTSAPFEGDADLAWFVGDCLAAGETVTIWPGAMPKVIP